MSELLEFGTMPDGQVVKRIQIDGGGLSAVVLTYGALLQDLRLEGHRPPLVLGFESLDDYLRHSPYFGATAGRYANRIGHGRFELDGTVCRLDLNQNGEHHLHGGSNGIGKRVWEVEDHGESHVRLTIRCADGEMGYPGNAHIATTYRLLPGGILSLVHETIADRPTVANLTHHSYFNLDGSDDILDHRLRMAADHYLPTGEGQIPDGTLRPVHDTRFDFREERPIGEPGDFDHNFCLAENRRAKTVVARLSSHRSGVSMKVATGEPGLQLYCGGKLDIPVPGLEGRKYGRNAGLCLETQNWPDAPNKKHFPGAVLRPGETLVQETDYIFSLS